MGDGVTLQQKPLLFVCFLLAVFTFHLFMRNTKQRNLLADMEEAIACEELALQETIQSTYTGSSYFKFEHSIFYHECFYGLLPKNAK